MNPVILSIIITVYNSELLCKFFSLTIADTICNYYGHKIENTKVCHLHLWNKNE
jgi:hypothetical protein